MKFCFEGIPNLNEEEFYGDDQSCGFLNHHLSEVNDLRREAFLRGYFLALPNDLSEEALIERQLDAGRLFEMEDKN